MANRVVVTGIGLVTPLGIGAAHNFSRIVAKESGIISTSSIPDLSDQEREQYAQVPSKAIGVVPRGKKTEGKLDVSEHLQDVRRLAKFSQYALIASQEALEDANWLQLTESEQNATGVCMGSCIGSFDDLYNNSIIFQEKGYRKIPPIFIPKYLNNMAAGAVSIKYGFKGLSHTVSTACATGSNAIGDAYRFIKDGYQNVMVAGATEAVTHPLALAGFARAKSLTLDFQDEPSRASRPFDSKRSGFVLSEGSGVLILENLEHALNRGVKKIYGEIIGYGLSSDAHHITAPPSLGEGAKRAMLSALRTSGLEYNPSKIDYINAHATSTKVGDSAENSALKDIFGAHKDQLVVSSNKGSIGHLLGAAGAVEAGFTLLAMNNGIIPPTLNCEDPGDASGAADYNREYIFNYAANQAVKKDIKYALSNSFGFGGVNASLCFKKYDE